jgi:lipopolysaccharide/colanic/teichoic acid biosynthesis glycosyltransferase
LIEESLSGEVKIEHLRENELGSLIPNLPYMSAKRAADLATSVILAPAVIAIGLIVALAIKLDSRGSVLFFQERVGFRGQSFRMVKFRTMREMQLADDEEARREEAMTRDADHRITRVGGFLRKTRLDELPQIWNILVGDMSWIGPRPEAQDLANWYEGEIPFYSYRHIVRPGITGWAQVNQGHVTSLEAVQAKLRFDFYYVKNLSLWLDMLIAMKTLRVVVQGIGAK